MFASFAILLIFQCLGEGIVFIFGLPIPGPVAGMLLLLGALLAWPRLQALVDEGARQLLSHLSLLFVPAGAGIVAAASVGNGHWLAIVASLLASTVLTLAVTAHVLRLFSDRQNRGVMGDDRV
jgi:holin-like protein